MRVSTSDAKPLGNLVDASPVGLEQYVGILRQAGQAIEPALRFGWRFTRACIILWRWYGIRLIRQRTPPTLVQGIEMRIVAIGRNPSRKPHIEPHPSRTTKGIGDMQPAPTHNPAPRPHKAPKTASGDVGLSPFRRNPAKRTGKQRN